MPRVLKAPDQAQPGRNGVVVQGPASDVQVLDAKCAIGLNATIFFGRLLMDRHGDAGYAPARSTEEAGGAYCRHRRSYWELRSRCESPRLGDELCS